MISEGSENTSAPQDAQSENNGGSGDTNQGGQPSPAEASAARISELETKVLEAEKKYLYLYSEFENFRRRNERERIDYLKFGHESFLKDLLQVLDNFERAVSHAKTVAGEKGSPAAVITQGVEMIHFQLLEALKAQGATPISAVGAKFDPAFHEAVGEEESDKEPGTILKELQKGYMLHNRLLRAAKVSVAKK